VQYKYYPLRVLQKLKLLELFNLKTSSLYAGKNFRIPIMNGIGLSNLITTEEWMKELLMKILKIKKGVFLDVGANIGQTLMKLRSFSTARYIGIEPNPDCVVYLEKLIQINRMERCTICPVGLSVKNELVTLYGNSPGASGASIIKNFRENVNKYLTHTHIISVMTGDHLVKTITPNEKVAVIKIDVEGAELEVLEGMRETLADSRPFIICEILPVYTLEKPNGLFRKERQDKLISLLRMNNYNIYRIKKENNFEHISEIEIHAEMELSDYVFVPAENVEIFFANTLII
jgi:FkbM family methyltransferase